MSLPGSKLLSDIRSTWARNGPVEVMRRAPGYFRWRIQKIKRIKRRFGKKIWIWKLRLGYASVGRTRIKVGFGVSDEMISSIPPDLELRERALAREIPKELPVIELGAGIGVVARNININLSKGKKHIAVEADSELIPVLENTRDLNDLSIQILNVAYNPSQETVSLKRKGGYQFTETTEVNSGIEVDAISLEELHDMVDSEYFTLVADIEGSEMGFLEEWSLIESNCWAAMIEFHEGTEELKDRFESSPVFEERNRLGEVRYYERDDEETTTIEKK